MHRKAKLNRTFKQQRWCKDRSKRVVIADTPQNQPYKAIELDVTVWLQLFAPQDESSCSEQSLH